MIALLSAGSWATPTAGQSRATEWCVGGPKQNGAGGREEGRGGGRRGKQ